MRRMTGQQVFRISVLLLIVCLAMSCSNADSRSGDTTDQSGTMGAQAGEHLQRITLRITGLS